MTLAVIVALFVLKRDRQAFYLAKGDPSAPAEPIRWLLVRRGDRWRTVGRDLTVFISLGTLAFLVISGRPSVDIVVRALPFLPAVLPAAAFNAFDTEVTYKASILSALVDPVGSRQALRMVASYFRIARFSGRAHLRTPRDRRGHSGRRLSGAPATCGRRAPAPVPVPP